MRPVLHTGKSSSTFSMLLFYYFILFCFFLNIAMKLWLLNLSNEVCYFTCLVLQMRAIEVFCWDVNLFNIAFHRPYYDRWYLY